MNLEKPNLNEKCGKCGKLGWVRRPNFLDAPILTRLFSTMKHGILCSKCLDELSTRRD
jgi:hypothetical protein